MVHLLIGVALLVGLGPPAGQRDHGRSGKIGILETRRQIGRADRLGHADTGMTCDPRIPVGHIGRRFLAMHHDAAHAQFLDLLERADTEDRHEEDVGQAITLQGFRQKPRTRHICHFHFPLISGPG